MEWFLIVLHVFICVILIALILLQQGKGAQMNASLGANASQTFFGSQGATSFLFKCTALLATFFMLTSLAVGYFIAQDAKTQGIVPLLDNLTQQSQLPAKK